LIAVVRISQAWWCIPAIPEFKALRQEDHMLKYNLGYIQVILSQIAKTK
jgi:hypothetical protein